MSENTPTLEKKPINIRDVEVSLYERFKEYAEENRITAGVLFQKSFEALLNNQSTEADLKTIEDELNNKENENENLKIEIQTLNQRISELQSSLENEKDNVKLKDNDIIVSVNNFEKALINHVCQQESKRVGKMVSPAELLITMFNNYTIKGKLFFFPTPSSNTINNIKREIGNE